jgi:hypothetical protein
MEAQQAFRNIRIVSQEGCRALFAMTVESFRIASKAKRKDAQWIPGCAGMTTTLARKRNTSQRASKVLKS